MTTRTAEHIRADIMQYCEDQSDAIKIDDEKLRPFALAVALVISQEAHRSDNRLRGEVKDLRDRIAHLDMVCRDRMTETKKET